MLVDMYSYLPYIAAAISAKNATDKKRLEIGEITSPKKVS